ncbi:uncharacterized protein Tco025E_10069 [Trypanosoma conorhini]|uniref:Uncharacterized protein n=1 Tax=Trypanosoma conorhini TaxID=83891 RepID=A0A3R7MU46_9TRYP|nr:uncharacterized protein Tco025E_10069 [Trypanosoma conorhini]RNE95319.1 hypothetical protein Tco025E_10069 [Trypanosoma conorhini]
MFFYARETGAAQQLYDQHRPRNSGAPECQRGSIAIRKAASLAALARDASVCRLCSKIAPRPHSPPNHRPGHARPENVNPYSFQTRPGPRQSRAGGTTLVNWCLANELSHLRRAAA